MTIKSPRPIEQDDGFDLVPMLHSDIFEATVLLNVASSLIDRAADMSDDLPDGRLDTEALEAAMATVFRLVEPIENRLHQALDAADSKPVLLH